MKQLITALLFVPIVFALVACNGVNETQPDREKGQMLPTESVGYNGLENEDSPNVPVDPGREQNIFSNPTDNPIAKNMVSNSDNDFLNELQTEVIALTNKYREENGLPALKADLELTKVAQIKSDDMATNDYFSHTSPTYGSPFDMLQEFGVDYTAAAENIAAGQQSPDEVVAGWINSPGHRKNILNEKVTHIGVGYVTNGNYWTQLFIKK